MTSNRRRSAVAVLTVVTATLLVGCGSQVPPSKFIADQGGLVGAGAGGTLSSGAVVPGSGNGTGGAGGTGTAAGGGSTGGSGFTGGGSSGGGGGSTGGGSTGGGSTGGGGSHSGGGSSGGGSTVGGSGGTGVSGTKAGSCAGFKNTDHITDSTIPIANISDTSGPVSGLFTGAQQGIKAYVAYFNATSSICGRKLSLENLDSQTSSTGDQQAATTACSNAFAILGSMGAFDDGGASTVTHCGIPDLRAAVTESDRLASPVVYAVQSLNVHYQPTTFADYYKRAYPGVQDKAAFLYIGAGAGAAQGQATIKMLKTQGYNLVYTSAVPVTEINYTGYVAKMQADGVKYVEYVGSAQQAVSIAKAMDQQNFHPVYVLDPEAYNPTFVESGGSAVNNVHIYINMLPFEEASKSPEMQLYEQWLQRTSPGAAPDYFGVFAWAAGELFTQEALKLGGKLTRTTLLQALHGVDNYTGNGMFGPQHVGAKMTGDCYNFITLKDGHWVREGPSNYTCGGVVNVG